MYSAKGFDEIFGLMKSGPIPARAINWTPYIIYGGLAVVGITCFVIYLNHRKNADNTDLSESQFQVVYDGQDLILARISRMESVLRKCESQQLLTDLGNQKPPQKDSAA